MKVLHVEGESYQFEDRLNEAIKWIELIKENLGDGKIFSGRIIDIKYSSHLDDSKDDYYTALILYEIT